MEQAKYKSFGDSDTCDSLMVYNIGRNGSADWYCRKYGKNINGGTVTAMMYCNTYNRLGCCFFDLCQKNGIDVD